MKVTLSQINTTPRDFEGNFAKIHDSIMNNRDSDLIVFPELTIPGYLSKDLVYTNNYIERNLVYLNRVVTASRNAPRSFIVLGYIDKNHKGIGKPFRNMAAVIKDGIIVATYQKQLLPFYDVFDEGRYFEPGNELTVVEINGVKWGIAICEDVWNDKGIDNYNYAANPIAAYRNIGISHVISINSSPYVRNKPAYRQKMLCESFSSGVIIYVNQIGGQDDLVFDGNSLIIKNGKVIFGAETKSESFAENRKDYHSSDFVYEFNPLIHKTSVPHIFKKNNSESESLFEMLVMGLRDYVYKSGFTDIVFGSSGGIDSALVAAIATESLGPKHVHGIRMPSIYSSSHSKDDARLLHDNLGCFDYLLPINHTKFIDEMHASYDSGTSTYTIDNLVQNVKKAKKYNKVADENLQARLRGNAIMHFSNAYNALPVTTGNKSELAVGYCTLYGDMCGGFAILSDLYKIQVYDLAKWYNEYVGGEVIPNNILTKKPSAELAPDQFDENALLPYPILDLILFNYIENYIDDFYVFSQRLVVPTFLKPYQEIYQTMFKKGLNGTEYERIIRLVDRNEFKRRQAAPGIKVSPVAFGTGRRLPIVKN